MTDKITLELTLDELKELDKNLYYCEETWSICDKIRNAYPKSPVVEAYKDWYGEYPPTSPDADKRDIARWHGFQAGYNAPKEEKVSEWEPTPQTPEQVADGLKEAFREAVKQGVVSSTKRETLTDAIWNWWEDVFTTNSNDDMETSIDDLVARVEAWLPTEHDTNSYKWNQCIRTIKEKLR